MSLPLDLTTEEIHRKYMYEKDRERTIKKAILVDAILVVILTLAIFLVIILPNIATYFSAVLILILFFSANHAAIRSILKSNADIRSITLGN